MRTGLLAATLPAIHALTGVHTPSGEVTKATRIMEAVAQAAREDKGAASLDGRLINYASVRMAETQKKADAIRGVLG